MRLELLHFIVRALKVVTVIVMVIVTTLWFVLANLFAGLTGRKKRLSVFRH